MDCSSGGIIESLSSSITCYNCQAINTTCALFAAENSTIILSDSSFTSCSSVIHSVYGNTTVNNLSFYDGTRAITLFGGTVIMDNCQFENVYRAVYVSFLGLFVTNSYFNENKEVLNFGVKLIFQVFYFYKLFKCKYC